eukprot:557640-Rhodomonas_salina.1
MQRGGRGPGRQRRGRGRRRWSRGGGRGSCSWCRRRRKPCACQFRASGRASGPDMARAGRRGGGGDQSSLTLRSMICSSNTACQPPPPQHSAPASPSHCRARKPGCKRGGCKRGCQRGGGGSPLARAQPPTGAWRRRRSGR